MEPDEAISIRGKMFHCDLCNVNIVSEKDVKDHLQGKKHQRLSGIQATRQKQAECSIFVGGLTKLVSELELTDYFAKFGSVAQVIVDKDKGKFAIVEFSQKESAETASEDEKQKMNGKKITVRPRENKPFAPKTKQHASAGKKSAREKELDAVVDKLVEAEDVSCQMTTLLEETCLNQSDLQLRYLICDLLQEVFVEMFPKCRVFPYGSSVSGFGVKGCDLDLQIDLGRDQEEFKYQFATLQVAQETDMDTNEQEDIATGQEAPSDEQLNTNRMTSDEIMELLSRLLKQCVPSCQQVKIIPSSRLPVIKFRHKESGLHCDLSLDNRLALKNTELLHFYCSLDARVRPLIFAVRHWARRHGLAGNQGPGPKLTNYAFTMLVIHYLHNTQPPVLPTVGLLKDLADPSEDSQIDGWDCSFTTDTSKVSCHENKEDTESLLKGFFSFYTKCDFTTSVLCPVSGHTIPLTQFLQDPHLKKAPGPSREFKVGPVNIQDPLELTHNVAMNVNDKTAGKLREELRNASLTCISLRYRKRGADTETGSLLRWGLQSLLEERGSGGAKGKESAAGTAPSVVIPLKMSQLTQEFVTSYQDDGEMKRGWCGRVEDFVMQLMGNVLGMECSVVELGENEEQMENGSTLHSSQAKCELTLGNRPETRRSGDDDAADSGLTEDLIDQEHDDDEEEDDDDNDDEPAPKRQRLDPYEDDQNDASMTSSGNTSLTSTDDLQSPQSTNSPTANHEDTKVHKVVTCKACHNVWVGRRKLRRKLQLDKPWGDATVDEMTREKFITEELIKSSSSSRPENWTKFKVELRHKLAPDCTAVILTFRCVQHESSVKDFAHFFDMFIAKMLNQLKV